MRTDLLYLTYKSSYRDLRQLLKNSNHSSFPLVDNPGGRGLILLIIITKIIEIVVENNVIIFLFRIACFDWFSGPL